MLIHFYSELFSNLYQVVNRLITKKQTICNWGYNRTRLSYLILPNICLYLA